MGKKFVVPPGVVTAAKAVLRQRVAAERKRAREQRAALWAEGEPDRLREQHREELLRLAKYVMGWLHDFFQSRNSEVVFAVRRNIILFRAHFSGEDLTAATMRSSAEFVFAKGSSAEYTGPGGSRVQSFYNLNNETYQKIVVTLHPNYLRRLAAHLKSGKVWDDIAAQMKD